MEDDIGEIFTTVWFGSFSTVDFHWCMMYGVEVSCVLLPFGLSPFVFLLYCDRSVAGSGWNRDCF